MVYVNGRKIEYAMSCEPTGDDLTIMQLMRTVSIDASVLPTDVIGGGGGGTEGGQEADDLVGRGKIEVLVIAGEEMIV
jgi:hypothetical protein